MKIQNIFSTGKMNKDVDERLVPNGEFIDALNVRVLNTAGSDAGAIENEKGNVKLTNLNVTNSPECIGSVSDEAKEKIYWFVVNDLGYSYIYEYDRTNDITSTVIADERTGNSQVLKFNKDYKITGVNVIYNSSKKSKLILWTDGLNQPRMIDINRSKSYGINNFYEDDISLYKKPPKAAPSVRPYNTSVATENAVKEQFFAFGYRYRYLDGGYSACSSFTYFQFTPKEFKIDFTSMENKGMENIFNGYKVSYNSGDHRVTDVQLLFKYPTEPTIYVVDNINKKDSSVLDNATETYDFTNKKIYKTLPQDEVFRTFDDVPLTAKAQDIINDRIVFGNTTSQYDIEEVKGSNENIRINYNVDIVSSTQEGQDVIGSRTVGNTKITFDLSSYELKKDFKITLFLAIQSDEQGTSPNEYFSGSAVCQSAFILSQEYSSVSSLVASTEFLECLSSLSSIFGSIVSTVTPPNALSLVYGSFSLDSSTSTGFTLLAPVNTHVTDDTPSDSSDNNNSSFTTEISEPFKFQDGSKSSLSESLSNVSLKTLRSYEVGLSYLDSYGRYSSILLPRESIGETSSEVFCPVEKSVNLNSLKITLNNKPPYWADRYKWFVKVNKDRHYNVYGTIFYEDGVYRWILLQGANLGKLEEGKNLIVKADDNGPLTKEVKTKILEITTKNAIDEVSVGEGWIKGNKDFEGENLIEKAGTYIKIRPSGFSMSFKEDNFIFYEKSNVAGNGFANTWSGTNRINIPTDIEQGLLQKISSGTVTNPITYINQTLTPGSDVTLELSYSESDGSPSFSYFKEWQVNGTYETTSTRNCFGLFLDSETSFPSLDIASYSGAQSGTTVKFTVDSLDDDDEKFYLYIYKLANSNRWLMKIEPSEGTALFENSTITARLDIILISGLAVFETEPIDIDDDIYYETEETFSIENGLHTGNLQNQTSSLPSISKLKFGNCFSFGNGVESVRVLDDRFKPSLDIKSRPNISIIEGYERKEDETKLIYSGAFNENTGYNTLNEFNSSRGITKYMDMKYGSIQKLFARESDLIVLQEDRVSKVLYGKNLLQSPDGSGSLSQIEKVLGQDVPYSGEYGISINPESFSNYEGRMYFTDANRGAVVKLSNDGLTPISYSGMKAFFKDSLYNNKAYYNIGGFDPKYHQYVLSMGNDQVPQEILELDCASSFTRTVSSAGFSYELNVGSFSGTTTIAYTTTASTNIVVVYNGVTHTNNGLTGTGQITFPVSSSDLNVTNIATVTLTPASTATISITHTCPVPDTLEVILVVVNDSQEVNQNIINRFKHNGAQGNIYNSDLDVFESDELTRYEVLTGYMGTDVIPSNGDTITISSLKQIGVHTGDFNDCNSLGYLVSAAGGLSVQNIIDQATYPTVTTSTTSSEEENATSFTFNRTNTSEKLYLVWNYIDSLPVLTNDSVTGVTNGGSSIINVVANDSIPSPYTLTIGTAPSYGTAVVNSDNTITYNHTSGNNLNDSFTYVVSRGGACQATATVTTQALAISVDTYIYIYFDNSGSMSTTESELQTLRTGALKGTLQDLYATAGTESSGNTDNATNGSDEYDSKVTIVYGTLTGSATWQNERTFAALGDNDVNDFISTSSHNNFPSDASNVIVIAFQDESTPYAAGGTGNTAPSRTATYDTDMADLRSRVTSLNSSNSGFYRGILMEVQGYAQFNAFIDAVIGGTGTYSGTNGLSDLVTGSSPTFNFVQNVEESDNNNANAPLKPTPYTGSFDQWQYYYLYLITDSLNTLGFSPSPGAWPIVIDD